MLYRDVLRYLGQPMPDISGIFTTGAAQPFIQPQPDGLEQVQEQIDMLEKYPVAYQPYMGSGGGGDGRDDDTGNIDTTNNAGLTGLPGLLTAASFVVNPIGTILGYGAKKAYDNYKNPYTDITGALNKDTRTAIQKEYETDAARRAREKAPDVYANLDKQTGNKGGSFSDQQTSNSAAQDHSQGQTGMGSCFISGTKVTMADGTLKNIEDIKVGDIVKGYEDYNEVIKLDPTLLGERKLYSFNDNEHYFFTSEHPFMTEEGWKSIKPEKTKERDGIELYNQLKGELKVGDKLVTEKGLVEIKEIKSKEMNDPKMPLYNFNVSNDNSYIADGYVVHNKGGSGGKIVCTMMNESYGFGSFRNKIWLKHSKGLAPEYQKGYHKIFLPLVKYSKQKGVTNKIVKNILEHIAVHRTIDIRQESRGKTHLLGRIYRKILEPICYLVGKNG